MLSSRKIDLLKEYRMGGMRIVCIKSKEYSLICPYDFDMGLHDDFYTFYSPGNKDFIVDQPPCVTCNLRQFRHMRLEHEEMIYSCWKGILVREEEN